MSTIFNDNKKSNEYQTMVNNKDIDQLHHDLIKSIEVSNFRHQSRDNLEQSWPLYRQLLKFLSPLIHIPSDILNNYIRTVFFIILLGLLFPFNLLITLFTLILSYFINILQHKQSTPKSNPNSKRIMISGGRMTKALQLCRSFYHAGHQIILVDESINWLTGHRWSNSVERFYVHPSPINESDAYINTLANIVRKEKIHLFIPIIPFHNSQIDAQVRSALAAHGCSTFHMNIEDMICVNNKYTFVDKARSLGLSVPKSFLITSRQQLIDFDFTTERCLYICKSAISNHLHKQPMIQLPQSTVIETIEYINKLSINEDCPYILQELISGKEYSTHGTCIDGELTLFTCTQSSSSQLNYKHIHHPAIFEWCTQYIRSLKLTGHISIDFIVSDNDGKAYAIACHPHVNSAITAFYNHPNLVDAYFPSELSSSIVPLSSARLIYWLPHEVWNIVRNIRSLKKSFQSLKTIFYGKEAIWSRDDPLPFLLHYHIHILYLLLDNLFSKHVRFFNKIDCCIGRFG